MSAMAFLLANFYNYYMHKWFWHFIWVVPYGDGIQSKLLVIWLFVTGFNILVSNFIILNSVLLVS